MNSFQWVNSLRHINCMEREDFIDCFGEQSGLYLWAKFVGDKKSDVFEFLCYLDMKNVQILYHYILIKTAKETPGLIKHLAGDKDET